MLLLRTGWRCNAATLCGLGARRHGGGSGICQSWYAESQASRGEALQRPTLILLALLFEELL